MEYPPGPLPTRGWLPRARAFERYQLAGGMVWPLSNWYGRCAGCRRQRLTYYLELNFRILDAGYVRFKATRLCLQCRQLIEADSETPFKVCPK